MDFQLRIFSTHKTNFIWDFLDLWHSDKRKKNLLKMSSTGLKDFCKMNQITPTSKDKLNVQSKQCMWLTSMRWGWNWTGSSFRLMRSYTMCEMCKIETMTSAMGVSWCCSCFPSGESLQVFIFHNQTQRQSLMRENRRKKWMEWGRPIK